MAVSDSKDQQGGPIESPKRLRSSGLPQKWLVIESALGSWDKTVQLCLILIALGISTAVSYGLGILLWLLIR